MNGVWILTEADEQIASGHLLECIDLAKDMMQAGIAVSFFVNADCPAAFQTRIPFAYQMYERNADGTLTMPQDAGARPDAFVFNFRAITNRVLDSFRGGGTLICIDEWGHRALDCDIIINPMVDPYYWHYDTNAKVYGGAEYLALSEKLQDYRRQEKLIREHIERICITMGGVDLHGTTVKLVRWLPEMRQALHGTLQHVDVVLGGGFSHDESLQEAIKASGCADLITTHRNIQNLYDFLMQADLAFCAGGNTLHELATLGVPAIVIPTMPHEWRNGKAFERKGCCMGLPLATELTESDVLAAVGTCMLIAERQKMCDAGRGQFDGLGRRRILKIVLFHCSNQTEVHVLD